MRKSEFPATVAESQKLMKELLEFAEVEKDRDKRREILLLSIELKEHISKLKSGNRKSA